MQHPLPTSAAPPTEFAKAIPDASTINAKTSIEKTSTKDHKSKHPIPSVSFNEVKIIENKILGEGSFSIVYKGMLGTQPVALKKARLTRDNKDLEDEKTLMEFIPNDYKVMRALASTMHENLMILVLPLRDCCLEEFLAKNPGISWSTKFKIIYELAYATMQLHALNISHNDMNSYNILLMNDGSGMLLSDLTNATLNKNLLPSDIKLMSLLFLEIILEGKMDNAFKHATLPTNDEIEKVLATVIPDLKFESKEEKTLLTQLIMNCLTEAPDKVWTAKQIVDTLKSFPTYQKVYKATASLQSHAALFTQQSAIPPKSAAVPATNLTLK